MTISDLAGSSTTAASTSLDNAASVSVLKKSQDQQRLQGAEAVRLIESSAPQMTKTSDGHISVRA